MKNRVTITIDNGWTKTYSMMEIGLRSDVEYTESEIKGAFMSLGYIVSRIVNIQ